MRTAAIIMAVLMPIGTFAADVPVTIDPATEHQIIDGFGANQPQYYYITDYFGGAILDLAFRRSGMGISMLRCDMPLGFEGVEGTSAGNDNGDPDVIDWSGFDKTILSSLAAVAQGAGARGCEKFIASPWSPPYWMKDNDSEIGGGRLLPGMEPELAEYFRAFLTYLSGGTGEVDPPVLFDHITIQNEPEVAPGWWGCQYTASELTYAMQFVGAMLASDFPAVTLAAGDNSTTTQTSTYLSTIMTDPVVAPMVGLYSVHPYNLNNYPGGLSWGNWTNPDSRIGPWSTYRVNTENLGFDIRSWVVEHCDHDNVNNPDPSRTTWASGLDGATHIHRALVNGGISAWAYWTLFRYNADLPGNGYGHALWYSEDADGNATLKATGKVSAFTPFYRYVRPAYRRVEATPSDTSTDLRVTAFKAPGGVDEALVIVVINRGAGEVSLNGFISDSGSIVTLQRCEAAEYDSGGTLRHGVRGGAPVTLLAGAFSTTVPAQSVTAFVHEAGSPWPTAAFDFNVSGLSLSVDAAASTPGTIERFEWDFGDGSIAEGITAIHDYAAAGTYDVSLTVTEQLGGVHTISQSVSTQTSNLSGQVLYYRNGAGLEPGDASVGNALLSLQGETISDSVFSDPATGSYSFPDFPQENITVTPAKDGEINGISSFDASQVSQHRVGLLTLTPNQQIAADVSGSASISSYDASLISQLRVGLITRFPVAVASGSDWAFVPVARTYEPLDTDLNGEDYLGVLYGDVTGNWTPPGAAAASEASELHSGLNSMRPQPAGEVRPADPKRSDGCLLSLRGPRMSRDQHGTIQLTVKAQGCQGLLGLDLDIASDPRSVSVIRAIRKDSALQFTMAANNRKGLLQLALYAIRPVLEDGDILVIEAEKTGLVPGFPAITIRSAVANEGQIPVSIRNAPFPRRTLPGHE